MALNCQIASQIDFHNTNVHIPKLQEVQKITRMSPYVLRKDKALYRRFIHLIKTHFTFVPLFDDDYITPDYLHLYHRRKSEVG